MFALLTFLCCFFTKQFMIDSQNLYRRLGEQISKRRRQLKLRQDDLAHQVGLTRTSITNIERGRQKVMLHHLFAIAEALGTKPDQLLPELEEIRETKIEELEQIRQYPSKERQWILEVVKGSSRKRDKQGGI
jgi:transcriptional regulator with XRE-family HTH domain